MVVLVEVPVNEVEVLELVDWVVVVELEVVVIEVEVDWLVVVELDVD